MILNKNVYYCRQWFTIKSWENPIYEYVFTIYMFLFRIYLIQLYMFRAELHLVKVWEIMYEAFPSLALQMYLLLLNENKFKSTVTASMLAICANASLSMWIYLISRSNKYDIYQTRKVTNINVELQPQTRDSVPSAEATPVTPGNNDTIPTFEAANINSVEIIERQHSLTDDGTNDNISPNISPNNSSINAITTSATNTNAITKQHWILDYYSHAYKYKSSFIFIYIYMVSDFYIRTFPIMSIIAWFTNLNANVATEQILIGVTFFIIIGIYSYYMCYIMRINSSIQYKSHNFLIKIFFVCIFSSFYNILCCFDFLENDPYFGMSVQFYKHLKEHCIRIFISIIMYIFLNYLVYYYNTQINSYTPFFVLYILFLILNIISLFIIKKYIDLRNKKMLQNHINQS